MKLENVNPKEALEYIHQSHHATHHNQVLTNEEFMDCKNTIKEALEELDQFKKAIPELIKLLGKDGVDSKHQAIERLKKLEGVK